MERTDRVQRLKDARTEAAKDIETLKAQKQAEFAAFEKKVLRKYQQALIWLNVLTCGSNTVSSCLFYF